MASDTHVCDIVARVIFTRRPLLSESVSSYYSKSVKELQLVYRQIYIAIPSFPSAFTSEFQRESGLARAGLLLVGLQSRHVEASAWECLVQPRPAPVRLEYLDRASGGQGCS